MVSELKVKGRIWNNCPHGNLSFCWNYLSLSPFWNITMDKIWCITKGNQLKEHSTGLGGTWSNMVLKDLVWKMPTSKVWSGCVGALLCCFLTPFCFAFWGRKKNWGSLLCVFEVPKSSTATEIKICGTILEVLNYQLRASVFVFIEPGSAALLCQCPTSLRTLHTLCEPKVVLGCRRLAPLFLACLG